MEKLNVLNTKHLANFDTNSADTETFSCCVLTISVVRCRVVPILIFALPVVYRWYQLGLPSSLPLSFSALTLLVLQQKGVIDSLSWADPGRFYSFAVFQKL